MRSIFFPFGTACASVIAQGGGGVVAVEEIFNFAFDPAVDAITA
jgi:hypothetical protein